MESAQDKKFLKEMVDVLKTILMLLEKKKNTLQYSVILKGVVDLIEGHFDLKD